MLANRHACKSVKCLKSHGDTITGSLTTVRLKLGLSQIGNKKCPANQTKKLHETSQNSHCCGNRHIRQGIRCKYLIYQNRHGYEKQSSQREAVPRNNKPIPAGIELTENMIGGLSKDVGIFKSLLE